MALTRTLPALALTALAALTASASAAAAPTPAGSGGVAPAGEQGGAGTPDSGGAAYGEAPPAEEQPRRSRPRRKRRAPRTGRPVLSAFEVSASRFYLYGAPARVRFRIDDRSDTVRVTLRVLRAGSRAPLVRIDLGERATGVQHSVSLTGREGERVLRQGAIELRLSARDPGGNRLRTGARASSTQALAFYWHRFPLGGSFTYGGEGARFGAERPGHSHQGQDLIAPEGAPVVAPRGGVVQTVAFQAGGAGHYVILDGEGEDRDYAFMHLQTGSIVVRAGQRVATGELLGRVGSTGASSGPHLHFEVWEGGGWYEGGHPVDPLPYLQRWHSWS